MIKIDHFSLKFLLDQRLVTIPQQQWTSKLIGFDFNVEYRLGAVAHTLSRWDAQEDATAMVLTAPSFMLFDNLCCELQGNANLRALKQAVQEDARGWRVVDEVVPTILNSAHGFGYEGTEKTLHQIHTNFLLPRA
jgi:hypothetical protein